MDVLLISLSLVLPLALLIIGFIFHKYPPKKINDWAGYRTSRSMKNIETWKEANQYSSQLLIRFSFPILILTVLGMLAFGRSEDGKIIVIMASLLLSLTGLFIIIGSTEKRLKKMFGE